MFDLYIVYLLSSLVVVTFIYLFVLLRKARNEILNEMKFLGIDHDKISLSIKNIKKEVEKNNEILKSYIDQENSYKLKEEDKEMELFLEELRKTGERQRSDAIKATSIESKNILEEKL